MAEVFDHPAGGHRRIILLAGVDEQGNGFAPRQGDALFIQRRAIRRDQSDRMRARRQRLIFARDIIAKIGSDAEAIHAQARARLIRIGLIEMNDAQLRRGRRRGGRRRIHVAALDRQARRQDENRRANAGDDG